jgi:hypothetical protein
MINRFAVKDSMDKNRSLVKKYDQTVATGTHVKIHVSPLLDWAKIAVPKTTKIFGSGTRTGVTGLRQPEGMGLSLEST